ncbi:phosphatidylethanolamine-binding protein homolog F40A3.3-like [Oppia nitens]|uniref:phosphatidylethanolamine-binding protein homolog F40A3.3-like n=1 Tax=Oppia nitens TaxID=1686743 RepID=UPI0023DB0ADB|nr:phosphatidylethanolamine-binding protein homolog F40A3.3-like [Oppia nitens]
MDKCVPDVIDIVPKNVIKIHYPSGVDVNLGNELKPVEVKDEPTVDWPTTQPDDLYTLLMTDPDASVDVREIKHWLIVNIPGNDLAKGELLAPYGGSCPPVEHGLHRYIFLVYKQSGHLQHSEIPMKLGDREGRRNFNTKFQS